MIVQKQRNSSTELFRILAMFLVVFVHMNGYFLVKGHGIPEDIYGGGYYKFVNEYITKGAFLHEYIQSLCRVCVNCFIIISGYYGIKLKFKSLWTIYFTVICVQVPFAIAMCLLDPNGDNIKSLFNSILGLTEHGYFVQCYVMLFFLSPLLNSFIEKYGRKVLYYTLLFVLIEGYICIFRIDEIGFEYGYRIIHFILMYLVARCLYLYKDELVKVSSWWYLLAYFGGALIMTLLIRQGFIQFGSYSNPLTIVMTIGLFIPFTKKTFYNRIVNLIAGGTFTVYLINTTMPGSGLYYKLDNYIFNNYTIFEYYPLAIGVSICLFVLSVVYDRVIKFVTKPLNGFIISVIDNRFKKNLLD